MNPNRIKLPSEIFLYPTHSVDAYFHTPFSQFLKQVDAHSTIWLTDKNIYKQYEYLLTGSKVITIEAGEAYKNQQVADTVINKLLQFEADKSTLLIGLGGGVVTDLAGYVASIFKRGIPLGLVPTSVLAMVDAAIGGKNGVNVGLYKNMVGTLYQPNFIFFDVNFLQTLPHEEWVNGFAEIIKHACIGNENMFAWLEANSLDYWKSNPLEMAGLIEQNARYKFSITQSDEKEINQRKWLNFGHSIGHAIENSAHLPHGQAVALGMVAATVISEIYQPLDPAFLPRLKHLLAQYQLPIQHQTDPKQVIQLIRADKKRTANEIDFIMLQKLGLATIVPISLDQLAIHINTFYQ